MRKGKFGIQKGEFVLQNGELGYQKVLHAISFAKNVEFDL